MPAQRIINDKKRIADGLFKEIKIWRLPESIPGCVHLYKYSLVLIANGHCVLRYDNERGKGDHKHVGGLETSIEWINLAALLADFDRDIQRWRYADGNADH